MPLQRARSTELAKLFNAAKQPIYVLDEELTIVFLNRACEDWLATAESLVGRRCAYHSGFTVTGLDAVAAGLCPPPCVLAGKIAVATVCRVDENGRQIVRRARFRAPGNRGGVFAGSVGRSGHGGPTDGPCRGRLRRRTGRSGAQRAARASPAFSPGGRGAIPSRSAHRRRASDAAGPAAGRVGRRLRVKCACGRSAWQRPPASGRRDSLWGQSALA